VKSAGFQKILGARKRSRDETHRFDNVDRTFADRFIVIERSSGTLL
jgi:hypothetical protein